MPVCIKVLLNSIKEGSFIKFCNPLRKVTFAKKLFLSINEFYTRGKNYVLFSRYLDFCVFHESANVKVYDFIINITAY